MIFSFYVDYFFNVEVGRLFLIGFYFQFSQIYIFVFAVFILSVRLFFLLLLPVLNTEKLYYFFLAVVIVFWRYVILPDFYIVLYEDLYVIDTRLNLLFARFFAGVSGFLFLLKSYYINSIGDILEYRSYFTVSRISCFIKGGIATFDFLSTFYIGLFFINFISYYQVLAFHGVFPANI